MYTTATAWCSWCSKQCTIMYICKKKKKNYTWLQSLPSLSMMSFNLEKTFGEGSSVAELSSATAADGRASKDFSVVLVLLLGLPAPSMMLSLSNDCSSLSCSRCSLSFLQFFNVGFPRWDVQHNEMQYCPLWNGSREYYLSTLHLQAPSLACWPSPPRCRHPRRAARILPADQQHLHISSAEPQWDVRWVCLGQPALAGAQVTLHCSGDCHLEGTRVKVQWTHFDSNAKVWGQVIKQWPQGRG